MLVNLHPYHVNVLLQIAYICNSGDDYALGSELLDRALYSLEHSFHPSFNILNAHCRLDYSCKENRFVIITPGYWNILKRNIDCFIKILCVWKFVWSFSPFIKLYNNFLLQLHFFTLTIFYFSWESVHSSSVELVFNVYMLP